MTEARPSRRLSLPPPARSLSARLLVLTVLFVMLAEVLIFAPSVGRYRLSYLEEKLATGHLGILALEASPVDMIDPVSEREILSHIGVYSVALQKPERPGKLMLMIEEPVGGVEASYDLREAGFFTLIRDAVGCLLPKSNRVIRVVGWSPQRADTLVEVVMDEGPLQDELRAFGWRILGLSLVISAITAGLVYLTLFRVMVVPMRRLTENMIAFRDDPEDGARVVKPSGRSDEIGVAERQLHEMQKALRASLHQKTRLAALGIAVTKINHDLRNMLSTAQLISDRLAQSSDSDVRRVAPTLFKAIDRAVELCGRTLDFTREGPASLDLCRVDLNALLADVGSDVTAEDPGGRQWDNRVVPGTVVEADRNQLFRVFENLARNAYQAGAERVTISARQQTGKIEVDLEDNGSGLTVRARERLFQPFAVSTRSGGTGLGLAIAKELLRAHGGDIRLKDSDASGTRFRVVLPLRQKGHLRRNGRGAKTAA
ncbi:ATP-binding protein [Algihabitans sp.]|uniref:ATP-binding protein n=1 Tax=Algihabitans sp. TaxID=2821514 RepID=UPI003BAA863D